MRWSVERVLPENRGNTTEIFNLIVEIWLRKATLKIKRLLRLAQSRVGKQTLWFLKFDQQYAFIKIGIGRT
jgi:hypothetical protein